MGNENDQPPSAAIHRYSAGPHDRRQHRPVHLLAPEPDRHQQRQRIERQHRLAQQRSGHRMYLTVPTTERGEELLDRNLRELRFKKNNYGLLGEPITLEWRNGVYVPLK